MHSTTHGIHEFVDQANTSFEEKETTIGVFMDLSKVFDKSDHRILLNRLDWHVQDTKSPTHTIPCGVPQGSVLF